jgi:hypothetical protein
MTGDMKAALEEIGREMDGKRSENAGSAERQIYITGFEDGLRYCLEVLGRVSGGR